MVANFQSCAVRIGHKNLHDKKRDSFALQYLPRLGTNYVFATLVPGVSHFSFASVSVGFGERDADRLLNAGSGGDSAGNVGLEGARTPAGVSSS